MSDPWNDPEMQEWMEQVKEELIPKLEQSDFVLPLYTGGADVKMGVEVGLAILMDKPIIVIVTPGAKCPNKLALVADKIIEADIKTPEGRDKLADKMKEVMDELA